MEVSTNGRNRSQYGSVTPVGLTAASVLARDDLGRLTINVRSLAAPAARVSAGLPNATASDWADSETELNCDGSPVLTQYWRPRGGCHVRPRVSVKWSVAAQSSSARPNAAPCVAERWRAAADTPAAARAAIWEPPSCAMATCVPGSPSRTSTPRTVDS